MNKGKYVDSMTPFPNDSVKIMLIFFTTRIYGQLYESSLFSLRYIHLFC